MAPEYAVDIERRRAEAVGDSRRPRTAPRTGTRRRVDEAADQPGAGDPIDLRPGARDPDGAAPLVARRHQVSGRTSGPPAAPSLEAALQDSAWTPSCRSQAAAPWLSFSPRWQTTTTRRPVNSAAQCGDLEVSCGRRRAACGDRAAWSSSMRPSTIDRRVGQADEAGELSGGDGVGCRHDASAPAEEYGRDTWAEASRGDRDETPWRLHAGTAGFRQMKLWEMPICRTLPRDDRTGSATNIKADRIELR